MHPRVLIVGTVPYNRKSTSRAFDAYFHFWERENVAQIFSNTKTPCKGHCSQLYQITDQRMMHRWFDPHIQTGRVFRYEDLPNAWESTDLETGSAIADRAYRIGSRHTPLTHLFRGLLWRKQFWCTPELNVWLDDFQPECVFLAFSNDYFIPRIALYVAERYGIPIVSAIGDDYYFCRRRSLSPIYQLYMVSYQRLIRRVLAHPGSAVYISDKIRDKYNSAFGLDGETVYLPSEVKRRPFHPIRLQEPRITYFGNIRMGRNRSLCDIADALGRIDPNWQLDVYSNETDPTVTEIFSAHPNLRFHGSVPYDDVCRETTTSDITVIVEGFRESDVAQSRYSLSTKAADALASGATILTYGSAECGVVEYMASTYAAAVCTERAQLEQVIRSLVFDADLQHTLYENALKVSIDHHRLEASAKTFTHVINRAIALNVVKTRKDSR